MRGRFGGRKIQRFSRSRSDAGKTTRQRSGHTAREDAEARLLNAQAASLEAATRLADAEAAKVAGESAQQPLQAQLLEAQIGKEQFEAEATDFATFREQALLIVFLVMVIFILALILIDPTMLQMLVTGGVLGAILGVAGVRYGKG